jgi:hypothetical protein
MFIEKSHPLHPRRCSGLKCCDKEEKVGRPQLNQGYLSGSREKGEGARLNASPTNVILAGQGRVGLAPTVYSKMHYHIHQYLRTRTRRYKIAPEERNIDRNHSTTIPLLRLKYKG